MLTTLRMATQIRHMRGLQELPNELLTEIGEILYASEKRSGLKSPDILDLSCVSRRLRIAMLPVLFRKLTFKRAEAFSDSLVYFSSSFESSNLASLVYIHRLSLSVCPVSIARDRPLPIHEPYNIHVRRRSGRVLSIDFESHHAAEVTGLRLQGRVATLDPQVRGVFEHRDALCDQRNSLHS
ncbi:hypothetical protein BC835DRAFT_334179 [Cytidiella melzeri]|nr:hypothetical protein BC835DRAFT_334179 [Cytidiella melzeri]